MNVIAIPEEERTGEIFRVINAEKFPKLLVNTKLQIQEVHRILSRIIFFLKPILRHIIQTMENQRQKENLNRSQGENLYLKGNKVKNYTSFPKPCKQEESRVK